MVPTRFLTIRCTWLSMAVTSCGLLSCASADEDAGDGMQNVEVETPEPEVPDPGATEPNAAAEPDPLSPEPQEQQATTPEVSDPAPRDSDSGEGGSGEGDSGSSANGGGAAGAPEEQPSPASGGASGSEAGGSGGVDGGPAGAGGTAGSPTVGVISFVQVEAEVFEPAGCSIMYCHGATAGGLSWSFAELVGPAAAEPVCGLTERVIPGDPEASILWQRVRPLEAEETERCAEAMPKGMAPLTPEQAQLVYDWIASGAAP